MNELLIYVVSFVHAYLRTLVPGGVKALAAENAALRHQLAIVTRGKKRAPNLELTDRVLLGLVKELISDKRLYKIAAAIKPATILKFHRALVKQKYQDLYAPKTKSTPGPKGISKEIEAAIVQMKQLNPNFGCRRIADMLQHYFGVEVSFQQVHRILEKYKLTGPKGPSWLSFLGQLKDSLWSIDFFQCESATLNTHTVMVAMEHRSRKIVGFAVRQGQVTGADACTMFAELAKGRVLPKYLSTDNGSVFQFERWKANLRILDIKEIKTIPDTPISHPFIERLIGSVRRECLDHMLFWGRRDLEKKLAKYQQFYNRHRTHYALNANTPDSCYENRQKKTLDIQNFRWMPLCRGVYHVPTEP